MPHPWPPTNWSGLQRLWSIRSASTSPMSPRQAEQFLPTPPRSPGIDVDAGGAAQGAGDPRGDEAPGVGPRPGVAGVGSGIRVRPLRPPPSGRERFATVRRPMEWQVPKLAAVFEARRRISPHLRPTPLFGYPALNDLVGTEVFVKHENHQPVGAFK